MAYLSKLNQIVKFQPDRSIFATVYSSAIELQGNQHFPPTALSHVRRQQVGTCQSCTSLCQLYVKGHLWGTEEIVARCHYKQCSTMTALDCRVTWPVECPSMQMTE